MSRYENNIQREMIPWDEVRPGMVLKNYGHAFHLEIHFVEKTYDDLFISTYLSVKEAGDVLIQRHRVVEKKMWDMMKNKYDGIGQYDNFATLCDEIRQNDDSLRIIIKEAFGYEFFELEIV